MIVNMMYISRTEELMKNVSCAVLLAFLNLSLISGQVMAAPAGSMLVGTVVNTQGNPVAGAKVIAKDPSGKVIGEAVTNNQGQYVIQNLPPGKYQLTLDPQVPFKGETVLASIPNEGLTVDWVVSSNAPAIATAIPGVTTAFAGVHSGFIPFVLFTASATTLAVICGTQRNCDDDKRRVGSPSF